MNKLSVLFISSLLVTAIFYKTINGQNMNLQITPAPQRITKTDFSESFNIGNKLKISANQDLISEIEIVLNDFLESLKSKFNLETIELLNSDSNADILLVLDNDFGSGLEEIPPKVINEAYGITINENNIKISARTGKGTYYALLTLEQLFLQFDQSLPVMEIIDYPDLPIRGVSDDISRGQVETVENFKRVIKFISRHKMNTYMPYMEDMIQFDEYPSIGKNRGALSKVEIKEIVDYAKKYFVEVIPIFQTLGHYENILTQEDFLKYAEFPGAASLDVSNEKTYILLDKLIKEVAEVFPSEYFHIGADESWDVGLGNSKSLVDSLGIAQVHANHYKKVYDICKKYGKKVMMYGDIILEHPEILQMLPKDIIVVNWRYHPRFEYPSVKEFVKAGIKYIVSPSVWNFFNPYPNYSFAFTNIKNLTESGIKNHSIGMINSNWGDWGAETLKELLLYGYAWSAHCAWNISESYDEKFDEIFWHQFFGIEGNKFSGISETLKHPLNIVFWNDVWMHPLSKRKNLPWWALRYPKAVQAEWLKKYTSKLSGEIKKLKNDIQVNRDYLDVLEFVLDLNSWFADKLKSNYSLKLIFEGKSDEYEEAVNSVNENISELRKLKEQHAELWNKYNKPDNLNLVLDKYERLIAYYKEIREQLINKELKSPYIESQWIYSPQIDSLPVKSARFKFEFEINGKIKSAKLQLLGDTYVQLFVNGEFVEKVYARRSGSLLVDYRRIKFLDVSKYLHEGKNTIEAVTRNFNRNGEAGVNIIAQIKTEKENLKILTDKNWMVQPEGSKDWLNATEKEYPYNVIAPNFETGRPSWIER